MRRGRWLGAAAVAVLGLGVGVPAVGAEMGAGPDGVAGVEALETFATGRVVDARTGLPLKGALVRYQPYGSPSPDGVDRTDADGLFEVTGLDHDEYAVRVTAPRYVGGYLGCGYVLVPTFEEACTFAPGPLGGDIGMVHR